MTLFGFDFLTVTKGLKERVKDCDAEYSFGEANHAV